ncbi:MAG: ankyrin repeat domain-containing protein, partial [Kangiellaceae bacterium]|nr:ankyrin repeat domain-containing protein [Kangiellaceae bacterium]
MANKCFEAVKNGDLKVLQKELTSTIINQKDDKGKTLLHYSIAQNNLHAVKLLLHHNANIELKDDEGFLPTDIMYNESWTDYGCISVSLKAVYKDIEQLLLSHMSSILFVNKRILFSAALEGSVAAVKEAIHSAGVWDVDIRLADGSTPLHLATKKGHSKVVIALLNQHQNNVKDKGYSMHSYINAKDSAGKTALDYAAENGFEDIIDVIKSQSEAAMIESQTLKGTKIKSQISPLQAFEQHILTNLLNVLQTDHIHGTLSGERLENLILNTDQTGTENKGCYGVYVNNKG